MPYDSETLHLTSKRLKVTLQICVPKMSNHGEGGLSDHGNHAETLGKDPIGVEKSFFFNFDLTNNFF
jgi:hypothetical protein